MTLQFDLPYPPSVNHYWRRVGARTLISRQGRIFRESVCSLLALRRLHPLDGPLSIEIDVFPPDHRRRDIDNLLKSLLDALEAAGVYHNDSQIVELTNIFEARILSVGIEALTVSLDGSPSAIDDFMKALHQYGIVESQRTGLVALPKLDRAAPSATSSATSSNATHSSQGKAR